MTQHTDPQPARTFANDFNQWRKNRTPDGEAGAKGKSGDGRAHGDRGSYAASGTNANEGSPGNAAISPDKSGGTAPDSLARE